jgi:hypothetical protein
MVIFLVSRCNLATLVLDISALELYWNRKSILGLSHNIEKYIGVISHAGF